MPSPPPSSSSIPAELVSHYNNCLASSLDALAPLKSRIVSFVHTAPWYTAALHQLKTTGRGLERLCKKTGLLIHIQLYKEHLCLYKNALTTAKSSYYSNLISSGKGNTRNLFSTVRHLLQPPTTLPTDISSDDCNDFLNFFTSKINTIHLQLAASSTSKDDPQWLSSTSHQLIPTLSNFSTATEFSITELIRKSKPTTCQLDPLPTALVKACVPSTCPLITRIINSSLATGTVPPNLKTAAITPTLKKPGADREYLNNYRPMFNLSFISFKNP